MIESCAVEITLDAKQQVTGLEIISSLNATNEFGQTAVKIIVWNIQATVGPRSAEIRADIKSRPIVGRWGDGSRRRFCWDVGGMRNNRRANCRERYAYQKQVFQSRPQSRFIPLRPANLSTKD